MTVVAGCVDVDVVVAAAVDRRRPVGRRSYPPTSVWSCTSRCPGTMAVCSASAAVAGEVAAAAVAAPSTPYCHRPCTPEPLLPVGHPVVGTLGLGRAAAAAAGRDNHWAEVDLGRQVAAAGSVAVAVVAVGPNVWTMTMTTVCS